MTSGASRSCKQSAIIVLTISFVTINSIYVLVNKPAIFNQEMLYPSIRAYFASDEKQPVRVSSKIVPESPKGKLTILAYTKWFGTKWPAFDESPTSLEKLGCPVSDCKMTYDRSKIGEADAVLFHARDMPSASELWRISETVRPSKQWWVYHILESPVNTPVAKPLDGLFNLTSTYRRDSDIFTPYGFFRKLKPNETRPDPNRNYFREKSKMTSWISSHCVKYRERVVRMLEKYGIQVNTGGRCSNEMPHKLTCRKRDCVEELKQHMFYLAWENSHCIDYVTEKYWRNALKRDLIPVVFGGSDYSQPDLVVPGSYINAQDFPSYEELANYLLRVASNESLYNSYFKWRQTYKVDQGVITHVSLVCNICKFLHNPSFPRKTYSNLSQYWGRRTTCHSPPNLS